MSGLPSQDASGPRTITAWIKLSERPTADQTILAWGGPDPDKQWLLEVDANRRLRFSCGGGYALASKAVGDTLWHHIAVALDPMVSNDPHISDIRLYVDGRLQPVYEMAEQEIDAVTTGDLSIGTFDLAGSQPFKGIIDDVRLYNVALAPAHVRTVYTATIPQ
jgi:hypothetical protein